MPASRFLKIVQETGQIPVCSFYLPVSTSRNHPVHIHTGALPFVNYSQRHRQKVTHTPRHTQSHALQDTETQANVQGLGFKV